MLLFYCFDSPPQLLSDVDALRLALTSRIDGTALEDVDSATHFVLAVLTLRSPHLKRTVLNLELERFKKRLSALKWRDVHSHLRGILDFFHSNDYQHKLRGREKLRWFLVTKVLSTLEINSEHAFHEEHSPECRKFQIRLPFVFARCMVAKRKVELTAGKTSIPCGLWRCLLEDVFIHILDIELDILQRDNALQDNIFKGEDDRFRKLVLFCQQKIEGTGFVSQLNIENLDEETKYFPPCMANLHQILRRTHRLSYDSRCQYTLFLKDAGLSVDDNITLWEREYSQPQCGASCCHDWEEKEGRYKYQVRHLYGLVGEKIPKVSRCCQVFIERFSSRMDGGCPFKDLSSEDLIYALPSSLKAAADEVLMWKEREQYRRCCAVYLYKQSRVRSSVSDVFSPIHYYSLARKGGR